jgi:hypothetical protein
MQLLVRATCRCMVSKTQIVIERKKLTLVDPQSDEWCEHSLTGDAKKGKNMKRRRLLSCKW